MRVHLLAGAAVLLMSSTAWAQSNPCEAEIAKVQAQVNEKQAMNQDDPDIDNARAILVRAAAKAIDGDIDGCLETVEYAKGPAGYMEGMSADAKPMMMDDTKRAQINEEYACEAQIVGVQKMIEEKEAQNQDDPAIENARAILARAGSAGAKGDTEMCLDLVNNAKGSAN